MIVFRTKIITWKNFFTFNPQVAGFENVNEINLIFQNWPISMIFTNIFYTLNFAEEHNLRYIIDDFRYS